MTTTDNKGASADQEKFDNWMHSRLFANPPQSVTPFDAFQAGASLAAQPVAAQVEAAPQAEQVAKADYDQLALDAADKIVGHFVADIPDWQMKARIQEEVHEAICAATQPSSNESSERAAAPADLSKLERVRETYRGLEVHSEGDLVYFADVQALLATARAAEGDARDAAQWREMLACVMAEIPNKFSRNDDNAPGHAHSKPGIWDSDNGAKAGKECAWCKVWNAARIALAAQQASAQKGGAA